MTRKDLQEKYNIYGNNKDISLYRKRGEYSYGIGYCGNVSLKNGKVVFNKKTYADIESLDAALREWEKSLPWPVDTYNPSVSSVYNLHNRITWYLTEKLGFQEKHIDWKTAYAKNIGPNCELLFKVENSRDFDKDTTVDIISKYGNMTFSSRFSDADDAADMISTIVRESILQMAADMVDALSIVPDTKIPDIKAFVDSNKSLFGVEQVDFKSMMISLLENELKKLKGE